ncbi:MAG: transketolase [Bacilli bacterium]|nr:transketolase [Bacilli bacterium]
MNQEDIRTLNELKILSIDMITRAGSGSPGLALSMAPIVYTLFHRHLCIRPNEPNWLNRDRLIVSSQGASSLIYAALHMAGFPIKKEDLMNYRTINSITPGILEYMRTPGVEATTGLHGEGIACATGVALAGKYIKNVFESEDDRLKLIDYTTYCLCDDADFMEGITNEALSFAGVQQLNNLIILYSCTNITEDGPLDTTINEDIVKKYQALGFYVDMLKDGSNIRDIDRAISSAKKSGRPSLLIFKTILGSGSFNENKSITYNRPLTTDDVANLRKKWNLFLPPFEISKDSIIYFQKGINDRSDKKYQKWQEIYKRLEGQQNPRLIEIKNALENKQWNFNFNSDNYKINDNYRESLRETNLKILNIIGGKTPLILGGSADSSLSCQSFLNNTGELNPKNKLGRNIRFGSRENAMASILNGMALVGLKVYGSTKLIYADYLKSSLRLTALMNLPVTYIFTHDTIHIGEDGPVMQPIEQLSMLHTTPNLICYRPGDIMEVMGSWECILKKNLPSALIITKNDSPKLPGSSAKEVSKGAYIIKKEKTKLDGILISSGSELVYALQMAYDFEQIGLDVRVVSMPSMELFLSEGKEYEELILPSTVKRIVISAENPLIWNRFTNSYESIIGINEFGYSGRPFEVEQKMGFDYLSLKAKVESLLR